MPKITPLILQQAQYPESRMPTHHYLWSRSNHMLLPTDPKCKLHIIHPDGDPNVVEGTIATSKIIPGHSIAHTLFQPIS
jgi:hypothetical protein